MSQNFISGRVKHYEVVDYLVQWSVVVFFIVVLYSCDFLLFVVFQFNCKSVQHSEE